MSVFTTPIPGQKHLSTAQRSVLLCMQKSGGGKSYAAVNDPTMLSLKRRGLATVKPGKITVWTLTAEGFAAAKSLSQPIDAAVFR